MDNHLRWKETSRELLRRCRIFDLYLSHQAPLSCSEEGAGFYLLESPDWITTVPVLTRGSRDVFIMVRQYRHGIDRITTEFPAGLAEPGEQPEQTARRELLEETGYRPGSIGQTGEVAAAPAFMTNRLFTFVAWDLTDTGTQNLDVHEQLDVVEVAAGELEDKLGTGEFVNSVTLVSYYQYLRFKGADRIRTGA